MKICNFAAGVSLNFWVGASLWEEAVLVPSTTDDAGCWDVLLDEQQSLASKLAITLDITPALELGRAKSSDRNLVEKHALF